jgi:hypothetical protein
MGGQDVEHHYQAPEIAEPKMNAPGATSTELGTEHKREAGLTFDPQRRPKNTPKGRK